MRKPDVELYELDDRDLSIAFAAKNLLWKLVRSPSISPEQVEAVAKILRVFDKIPNTSDQFDAIIELSGPRRWYGEHEIWHYWHISIDQQALEVSSGGHFYRQSTG